MVIIGQKSFNDEMEKYLEGLRKKSGDSGSKFKLFKGYVDEEVPDMNDKEVHVEYKEPSFFRKLFRIKRKERIEDSSEDLSPEEMDKLESMEDEVEAIEEKEDELEEMEEELEERRESILQKIMFSLKLAKRKHDHELEEDFEEREEQVHELEEDVKNVLKIAHSWLEKLPPRAKKEFKTSNDFEKYKGILEKYGLVKPKEEVKPKTRIENKSGSLKK